jgi:predicted nucleic acid-binding protein
VSFVLDNSVALTWCFEDECTLATDVLLNQLSEVGAIVPQLWPLEAVNGLLIAERRNRITTAKRKELTGFLRKLPIIIDVETNDRVWAATARLADQFRLTIYDATYLELAVRFKVPLASLDKNLRIAARKLDLKILGA